MIKFNALWAIGESSQGEIDNLGIAQATRLAAKRAVEQLKPDYLLFDGRESIKVSIPQKSIIDGDALSVSIAAASIIANVYRDTLMVEYNLKYPDYGFDSHVGYGTKDHLEALANLGPCPIHRLSYKPVKRLAQLDRMARKNIVSV